MPAYKVNIFRTVAGAYSVYYLQISGIPERDSLESIQGEMYKALCRLQLRCKKEEENLHTYLAYDVSFEKWLRELEAVELWKNLWKLPVFSDYHRSENLKWLLQSIPKKAWPSKAYILGSGAGVREWLPLVVPHVKRLDFYVEFVTKGLEELAEELLAEYGIITEYKLVVPGEYRRERLQSREPVLVIDFSGSAPVSVLGLARGSIWVDMDSVETKRHLIEDRHTGISYLSLKILWKREMLETLDTISKFAYNTEVKIGK